MDLNEIRKLLELMELNKLVEFEFEEGDKKIRLRRSEDRPSAPPSVVVTPAMAVPQAMPAPSAPVAPPVVDAAPASPSNLFEFKSPLVGTFYRSPKPDADSFVNPGDEIGPEKVICIIEAMKVMNEIKAEMAGVVKEVLVKNGQAVEFGETLFLIQKK